MNNIDRIICLKFVILFFVVVIGQPLFGQANDTTSSKYSGVYTGQLDSVTSQESSHIFIRLGLRPDSLFYYDIGGVFSWCNSMSFECRGRWLADGDWLYFKPDSTQSGAQYFMPAFPNTYPASARTKEEQYWLDKHRAEGYVYALRITTDASGCPNIYFDIDWDCLGMWRNRQIKKTECAH